MIIEQPPALNATHPPYLQVVVTKLQRIVKEGNLNEAIRVIPGRKLLDKFVSKIGVVDANALARTARGHLKAKDFKLIHALHDRLTDILKRDSAYKPIGMQISERYCTLDAFLEARFVLL